MTASFNYIPHHCVTKADSSTTKLRVVFDGSCQTSNGLSLNNILRVGPTLQEDIYSILTRFRFHKYAMVADIAKMYRQVLVNDEDCRWQCILWRFSPQEPLQTYKLNTVTYGTSCAPYLAVKSLQAAAEAEAPNFPLGSHVTMRDFYVDNLITGSDTIENTIEIKRQVTELLKKSGFVLRKFGANNEEILDDISPPDREEIITVDDFQYIKTLGLKWSPTEDVFTYTYNNMNDASTKAYGACIYAVTHESGEVFSSLLCSKSRVAPLKPTTLPRLELCAALLAAQLLNSVLSLLPVAPKNIVCWSDSTIALCWIAGEPTRWTTFVSNRVIKIHQYCPSIKWRHVPSQLNPADIVSRGATASQLIENDLWLHGPPFLREDIECWPDEITPHPEESVCEIRKTKVALVAIVNDDWISCHKYINNYEKMLKIIAYIIRYVGKLRKADTNHGALKNNSA
ncbi:uncharacterized protein [Musca autumnalis]|uniref:uncharacterized protein n=1 Tax=Musca autumnalis TaxID=221902 RepID=UPI003CF065B0